MTRLQGDAQGALAEDKSPVLNQRARGVCRCGGHCPVGPIDPEVGDAAMPLALSTLR